MSMGKEAVPKQGEQMMEVDSINDRGARWVARQRIIWIYLKLMLFCSITTDTIWM